MKNFIIPEIKIAEFDKETVLTASETLATYDKYVQGAGVHSKTFSWKTVKDSLTFIP